MAALPVPTGVIVFWSVFLGGALLFPIVLRVVLAVRYKVRKARTCEERVLRRYQKLGTFAWMFAFFKLRMDPMFGELPGIVAGAGVVRRALDVGCGYGVAGCWLLEWVEGISVLGVDPNPRRVRAAGAAFGRRGEAKVGAAPDFELPVEEGGLDLVMMLDMIHFLNDEALAATLRRVRGSMRRGGRLVIRSNLPPAGGGSWRWRLGALRKKVRGEFACVRTKERIEEAIGAAGFVLEGSEISGTNAELRWFQARA